MIGKKKIILIVILAIIILLLVGAAMYYTKVIHVVKKIDKNKDVVYTSYEKKADEYTYSIPYINIDSEDAKKINEEIEDYYVTLAEKGVKSDTEGLSVITHKIEYNAYTNGEILSLIIISYYDNDYVQYRAYNINMYKGKIVTNSDLIALKKISKEDFLKQLEELYEKKFISLYGSKEEFDSGSNSRITELQKLYEEAYSQTISEENYSIETPIFLNKDGKISAIAKIYSLAGAMYYYHILDTNI